MVSVRNAQLGPLRGRGQQAHRDKGSDAAGGVRPVTRQPKAGRALSVGGPRAVTIGMTAATVDGEGLWRRESPEVARVWDAATFFMPHVVRRTGLEMPWPAARRPE